MLNSSDFLAAKTERRKLSMATCYDFTFARLLAQSCVDAILVGDSAAMVMHGYPSTIYADVDMIRAHTAAVMRGAPGKFVVSDMPFLSCRKGVIAAVEAASVLMQAGAQAVKIEGVNGHEDVIGHLVQSGVPVMGHLGLQPQSIHAEGGYRVQGRTPESAREIVRQTSVLERLGVFAVVLECVPSALAAEITGMLRVPTIGIGAGPDCDGQVLVLQDLLGMNEQFRPRFVRTFGHGAAWIGQALAGFDAAVKAGTFPTMEESYKA